MNCECCNRNAGIGESVCFLEISKSIKWSLLANHFKILTVNYRAALVKFRSDGVPDQCLVFIGISSTY